MTPPVNNMVFINYTQTRLVLPKLEDGVDEAGEVMCQTLASNHTTLQICM